MTKAIEAACIAFNQVLLNQPEHERNQPVAMQAAITAYLAAMEAEGFVMVPVEPTFAMKMAGAEAITEDHMNKKANYDAACDCWPAMIAASTQHDDGGE